MTLRDDLLPVFGEVARQIPVDLGVRTAVVKREIMEWSGGSVGAGDEAIANSITITPAPKVRVNSAGPQFLNVGPITPRYGSRGYTPDDLNPRTLGAAQSFRYTITGPDGPKLYRLVDINDTRAFGYTLVLESLERSPPT